MKTIKAEIAVKPIVDNFFGNKIQMVVDMQSIKGGKKPSCFLCLKGLSDCRYPNCSC